MADSGKLLVSIGMPVYNGERSIREALDSLLAQDYGNFELILSDNASTDATAQICQEYLSKDKRISYFRNDCKVEQMANFRLALDKARGAYFMWAAADDRWLPGFVSALAAELDPHPAVGVAMCAIDRIREDGTLLDHVRYTDMASAKRMKFLTQAMALAAGGPHHLYFYGLFRTNFIKNAFERFPMVAMGDRLFVCELALATDFGYVDQMLHIRTVHDRPMTERYAGEEIGHLWMNRLAYVKLVCAVGPYLLGSQVIPWRRKWFVPLVVLRFAWSHRKRIRRAIWGWIFPTLQRPRHRKVR